MNSLEFYKSFYDRELSRRIDLDSALNIPIGLIAILIALVSYLILNINFIENFFISCLITSLTIISVLFVFLAIYFLSMSYNNVFRGYKYLNFPLTNEIRRYQIDLESYNSVHPEEKDKNSIEVQLIEKMNRYTDNHILINDYRQFNLHRAKSFIVGSVFILLVALILVITKKYLL